MAAVTAVATTGVTMVEVTTEATVEVTPNMVGATTVAGTVEGIGAGGIGLVVVAAIGMGGGGPMVKAHDGV